VPDHDDEVKAIPLLVVEFEPHPDRFCGLAL